MATALPSVMGGPQLREALQQVLPEQVPGAPSVGRGEQRWRLRLEIWVMYGLWAQPHV